MKTVDLMSRLPTFLFWDVDPSRLDPETDAVFIISRVMDRGTRAEVDWVRSFYGDEALQRHLLKAPSLDRRTVSYFASQFGIPREKFRSEQRRKLAANWR